MNSSPPSLARVSLLVNCELDAVGNGGKDLVAGSMTVDIVDGFEIVQIEADNCEYAAASHGLSHRVLESIVKKRAIGQSSEDVVLRDSPQSLFVFLICGDIGKKCDIALGFT